jgi:hypothetical protein
MCGKAPEHVKQLHLLLGTHWSKLNHFNFMLDAILEENFLSYLTKMS